MNMPHISLMDIFATYIVNIIKDKKSLRYLVNEKVVEYINKNNLF
jgi:nicotinic acid mononucleotide adenylyltransferase